MKKNYQDKATFLVANRPQYVPAFFVSGDDYNPNAAPEFLIYLITKCCDKRKNTPMPFGVGVFVCLILETTMSKI